MAQAPAAGGQAPPRAESASGGRTPKVLTLAIETELKGFVVELALENARIGGVKQPKPMVHNLLTAENDKQESIPELAPEPISVERATRPVSSANRT
jgi:hypothetical protein